MMEEGFEGQVAVVTGSGRGIGEAIALAFAGWGAGVAVLDVEADTAARTAGAARDLGAEAIAIRVDVGDPQDVVAAFSAVTPSFGRVDVLVNNAGIETMRPFLDVEIDEWNRQVRTNLTGTFLCMQAAARVMSERGYGRIVNISSVAGLMGPIDLAPYGAVKAGIIGLTRAGALDLADHGITVNAVAPGPIETGLLATVWSPDAMAERAAHAPVARFGSVEEVARAVLFLASPSSGFINGVTLPVDGGATSSGAYMVEKQRRRRVGRQAP